LVKQTGRIYHKDAAGTISPKQTELNQNSNWKIFITFTPIQVK